jgi:hypothetical protein
MQPTAIGGDDIQKNVGIDQGHFFDRREVVDSPRLNSMNSSVVMPPRMSRRLAKACSLAS